MNIHGTWGEKSTATLNTLMSMVTAYLTENSLTQYEVKHRMIGFNDAFIVKSTNKNITDEFHFVSVVIGWAWADAELAIVHQYSTNNYELETDKHLEVDNSKFEMDVERSTDELKSNKIKYYESPFTERITDIYDDVIAAIKIIETLEGGN